MAALGGCSNSADNLSDKNKSPQVTAQKVRQLLNEGVASEDSKQNAEAEQEGEAVAPNGVTQIPCEAVSKEAFFLRVESYSCLKWAGKPTLLSPLRCAQYGWVNVDCDMLKCSSCQAFLCVSLQPTLDIEKYDGRLGELTTLLQTQHEKFCFWPDFPCPERFWAIPIGEPDVLLSAFVDRYRSSCLLEQRLPAMRPEDLKAVSLTEDAIGVLLQLLEDELAREGRPAAPLPAEPVSVQVAACIVALCGWTASPSLTSLHLPALTCSYCLRKVGLWSFHQVEGLPRDADVSLEVPSTPTLGQDVHPATLPTPCRMKLRSQDTVRSHGHEPVELSPSPVWGRARSRESPSPTEELPSPQRGKRPVTRSQGQGEAVVAEVPSSPQRKAKRPRLSSGSMEAPLHRGVFDPVGQHRDWCPWVTAVSGDTLGETQLTKPQPLLPEAEHPLQAWKAALHLFLSMKKPDNTAESSLSQGLHDKSKRVFRIFHQWQLSSAH
ncbi:zinc finger C3HC-type protein 1 [Paramormyrops kingsleyae]|uniref:Zinc finger, C3HC-type containing 1 n=1 Tax=Paramormyrops kingsleyae TaxID=1676925 RepID=A0A3B3S0D7_9TELE|nr:nuclear-interacting partner of ALK isoform X1 [Paramormyrops kingsleyae]